jgi:hypothetical protein
MGIGRLAACLMAVMLSLMALPDAQATGVVSTTMDATAFVAAVKAGQATDLANVEVHGDVDLRPLQTVKYPVRCRQCRFLGSIIGIDVLFAGLVDLTSTEISGNFDVHGATFESPFIADGSASQPSCIDGPADFTATTFNDVASFDYVAFSDAANFAMARFDDAASFADTGFRDIAMFRRTTFAGEVRFGSRPGANPIPSCAGARLGVFEHDADFTRAVFESNADFSWRRLYGIGEFSGATFAEHADFGSVEFARDADFAGATFGSVSIRLSKVGGTANFSYSVIGETATFDHAWLDGPLNMEGMVSQGTVSIRSVEMEGRSPHDISFNDSSIETLLMDIELIQWVPGWIEQSRILTLIEDSAKKRGDLSVANDARYARLKLENEQRDADLWSGFSLKPWEWIHGEGLHRTADTIGYRIIGGYLVKPGNPLVAFIALLIIGGAIRSIYSFSPELRRHSRTFFGRLGRGIRDSTEARTRNHLTPRSHRVARRTQRSSRRLEPGIRRNAVAGARSFSKSVWRSLAALTHNVGVSLRNAIRKTPADLDGRSDGYVIAVWLESLAGKVLLALSVIAIANASPTLRQIIDTVTQR